MYIANVGYKYICMQLYAHYFSQENELAHGYFSESNQDPKKTLALLLQIYQIFTVFVVGLQLMTKLLTLW